MALALMLKVFFASDLALTFAEDPMEIWIALGVAFLLLFHEADNPKKLEVTP